MSGFDAIEFGRRVRLKREQRGLKSGQLAKLVGWDRHFMCHVEAGRKPPSVESVIKLAEALDCSTDYLLQRIPR